MAQLGNNPIQSLECVASTDGINEPMILVTRPWAEDIPARMGFSLADVVVLFLILNVVPNIIIFLCVQLGKSVHSMKCRSDAGHPISCRIA